MKKLEGHECPILRRRRIENDSTKCNRSITVDLCSRSGRDAGLSEGKIMSKRIKVADLPEFDAAHYLDSETSIAAYLTDIMEANDAALLAAALGDIARARGMTEIAKSAGITREALYKALRPDSAPRFDTVNRVCAALGVRLVAQAIHP
jgi:probable addiction module antidote protein